jgi:iron complex transport system permease protein
MAKNEEIFIERKKRWKIVILFLSFLLIISLLTSSIIGFARISPIDVAVILLSRIPFLNSYMPTLPENIETIILLIRLPRVFAGAVVGSGLAVAGAVFQAIFRNPMADPYIIGSSSGAALGATLAIALGFTYTLLGFSAISLFAFIGTLLAVFLVYNIARVGGKVPIGTLLLSGIAVSIFLSALVTLIQLTYGERLHVMVLWLIGGFAYVEWSEVLISLPLVVVSSILLILYSRQLNIILLGEESAQNLGIDVQSLRKKLLTLASLATASSVAISGLIGFVGLIVPHITRILVGPDHRILLPSSMLLGAVFLIACDSLARVIVIPGELPVGIITATTGAPFFIYLLKKRKEEYAI